ncbi:MAG: hypothetical protein ACREDF_02395, partial [Thermoplasmata archaeon]
MVGFAPIVSATHDTIPWSRYWTPTFNPRHQMFPSVFTDQQGGLYFFQYDVDPVNGNRNVTMWKYATRGVSGNPEPMFSGLVNPTLQNVALSFNWYG